MRQPGWFIALLIVFAVGTGATGGLFLWKHAEEAALWERHQGLKRDRETYSIRDGQIKDVPRVMDEELTAKRAKINDGDMAEKGFRGDVDNLVAQNVVTKTKLGEKLDAELKTYKQLLVDAKARRLELKQEEERALATEREQDDKRVKSRDVVELLSREVETIKRETLKASRLTEQRIDELDDRIDQLTKARETHVKELRSDGQIIASRASDGYVVIDKGQQHNLRKGTRFSVYNLLGGRLTIKGAIEVVEVEARMSMCRVREERDANNPLLPGDHIHNPVYNPGDTKTFVIKGDFYRFSRDELARFITESGGKVAPELTTKSDYLVAGDRAEQALADANRIGVSVISEEQLLDFVRYTPKFSVREGMVFVLKGRFTAVSESKIRSFIIENGGKVESDLGNHTSVLVAGEGASTERGKAERLGVTVVDQGQFGHLAGSTGGKK